MYDLGDGIRLDAARALEFYQQAAKQGNAEAQNMLGWHYYTIASYNEAIDWYQKAAKQGNAEAHYRLGEINQEGWGVKQSYAQAIDWYTKAANLGSGSAQFTLGLMYYDGEGVYKDIATAKDLLNKACDNDYPSACHRYANLFLLQTE